MMFLQRNASQAADVAFEGDRARILRDGVVVRDWAEGSVLPDVPQGAGYTLEIERGGQIITDTLAIGIVVGAIGQSNMSFWSANGDKKGGVVDALPGTFGLSNGVWGSIGGDAARTFANALAASTGVPVAMVDASLGGTSLLSKYGNANGNWEASDPASLYGRFLDKLDAAGGRAEVVLWIQGENDARAGATAAEYLAGLNDLFARLRADVGPSAILASKLGDTIYGEAAWTPYMTADQAAAIREAQGLADAANDDVRFVDAGDLGLQDQIHRTTVGSAIEAVRLAEAYVEAVGIAPADPHVFGTAGADALAGSAARDVIEGLEGDDRIDAGAGHDLVLGGEGADEIDGGEGGDLLSGGAGSDVIRGGDGSDRITGDGGDDTIDGGTGDDVAAGGFGNDTIDGGLGDDALDGGLGDDAVSGGEGNDVIRLGAGNDRIDAGAGDDLILVENYGNFNYSGPAYGVSVVDGGEGWDRLVAGANRTVISLKEIRGVEVIDAGGYTGVRLAGSSDADSFDLRSTTLVGIASIETGDGDDVVFGTAAADRILGGAGNDRLTGADGDDFLVGGRGDDVVDGGAGVDLLQLSGRFSETIIDRIRGTISNAADGTDTVSGIEFVNFLDGVYDWNRDTFTATPPFSGVSITGTSASDRIGPDLSVGKQPTASEYNDEIFGLAGDDHLDGGAGADRLVGGTGGDTYYVDDVLDRVVEAANEGTDVVRASVSYALPDNVERLVLTGSAAIDGTGNGLANFLTGNDAPNTLAGGGGDDRLYGEGGADVLVGGTGNDLYYVDSSDDRVVEAPGEGTDSVNASASFVLSDNVENLTLTGSAAIDGTGNGLANTILGNSADNVLRGGAGADLLTGGSGSDTLHGEADNDRLDGGAGDDTMIGGRGDDTYFVDAAGDAVMEAAGEGNDLVSTSVSYTLTDNVERLVLTGTAAIDGTGNGLANTLTGNAGANVLSGGGGNDTIDGGAGADTAAYAGRYADYVINRANGTVSSTLEGVDKLKAIETLRFSDGSYDWASGVFTQLNTPPTLGIGAQSGAIVESTTGAPGRPEAIIDLIAGDADPGDVASFVSTGWTVVDATHWSRTGLYGSAVLDVPSGRVTYTLDNARGATDALAGGQSARDAFAIAVQDRSGASLNGTVVFEIAGADDKAMASSARVTLAEGNRAGDVSASGQLSISDPDSAPGFVAARFSGVFGAFAISETGVWSYVSASAQDDLAAGERRFERFAVTTSDGGAASVEVEIVGTNDAPVLTAGLQSASLVEATPGDAGRATAAIALTWADADAGDTVLFDPAGWQAIDATHWVKSGTFGTAVFDTASGELSYTLDNLLAATNALAGGTTAVDSFLVTVRDGSGAAASASAAFTILGQSDGVLITGTAASEMFGPQGSSSKQQKATAFDDAIYGYGGDDHLNGGAGADLLVGGTGGDTYYVDDALDRVIEAAGEGTDVVYASISYALTDNVERLFLTGAAAIDGTGNALSNFLTGNGAANTLVGGAGDDRLYGEGGADTLIGGTGNDLYYVDDPDDRIVEVAGEGTDTVNASASYVLSENVENLTLTGSAGVNGTGNSHSNILLGNAGANVLSGGGGSDYLRGYAGADTFLFDAALNTKQNVDTIADFDKSEDRIALDSRIFASLNQGALAASEFAIGKAAVTADQHIVFDSASGKLFYDVDGVGGVAQVQFALLTGGALLDIGNFDIV